MAFGSGYLAEHPLPPGILGSLGLAGYQLLVDVAGVGAGITQGVTWSYVGDQINAGTYTAKATYAGDANHYGSDGSATMTIVKATLTGFTSIWSRTG